MRKNVRRINIQVKSRKAEGKETETEKQTEDVISKDREKAKSVTSGLEEGREEGRKEEGRRRRAGVQAKRGSSGNHI